MKISKKFVKRVFKVVLVVSCTLVLPINRVFSEESTLGNNSAYTIKEGTSSDYDYKSYSVNSNGEIQTHYYKYNLKNSYSNHGRITAGNNGQDINSNFVNSSQTGNQKAQGGAIYLSEVDNSYVDQPRQSIGNIVGDFINNYVTPNADYYLNYAYGGAIYSWNGEIKSITGDFINNYAEGKYAFGGAIHYYNPMRDDIEFIKGKFINNHVIGSGEDSGGGGAIYIGGTNSKINNLVGLFSGNYANSGVGGAIYNWGGSANISGKFYNNYASKGGAIYTTNDLTIFADGSNEDTKLTEFIGNHRLDGENDAIFVETSSVVKPIINLEAKNAGTIRFEDKISGSNNYQYNLEIKGDNTSKVILNNSVINANASLNDTNLYLSETALADENTNLNANSGTVHLANGKSENYQINKLTSLESANYTVDVDLTKTAPVPDTITTGAGSSGTVTISDININGELKDFNAQILKAQDDNIQLGLSDNLKDKYNTTSTETIHSSDTVQANVNWKDKFNKYEQTNTTTTGLSLSTTNTNNDSIEYSTKTIEGEKVVSGSMGDTLALVNQLQNHNDRSLNFETSEDTYVVSSDLGQTSAGKLSINGVKSENSESTVDLNTNKGFELANNSTLVINNAKLTGNENLVIVTNSDAVVELNNAYINGNITGDKNYDININGEGTTTINGNVNYANTTLSNGTLKFNSNTFIEQIISLDLEIICFYFTLNRLKLNN